MAGLKPNEEIMAASFAVAAVYGVFSTHAPNMADVKASKAGNANTHSSVKSAVITSAAIVSGIALLAKSPVVYVVGGLTIAIEGWSYFHANSVNPATGKTTTDQQGQ
jgi:hypothetical protein